MNDYSELINALKRVHKCETCAGLNDCFCERRTDIIRQATDAIESLQAQIPHWISVEERLPELHRNDSGCVCTNTILYRTQYKTVHLGYAIRTAHNIETMDGVKQIVVDRWYDQSGEMIDGVTHWMPLPAPPKEDAE